MSDKRVSSGGESTSSYDPTGLDDLEDLARRWAELDTFGESSRSTADSESEKETVRGARQIYDSLGAILEDEGHTVKNGIIMLRATDKVLHAWNDLVRANNMNEAAYISAALHTVDPKNQADDDSVYYLTGRAFASILETVECSRDGFLDIKNGIQAMRTQIGDALDREEANGKANTIRKIIGDLIRLEREFGMIQTASDINLSLPASTSSRSPKKRRGNLDAGNAEGWTDEQRLELLKIYRDNPKQTHEQKASLLTARFPDAGRSKSAIRQEHSKLVNTGVTIANLEAKLGRT